MSKANNVLKQLDSTNETYVELFDMDDDFTKGLKLIRKAWDKWKKGPETKSSDEPKARKEVANYIMNKLM